MGGRSSAGNVGHEPLTHSMGLMQPVCTHGSDPQGAPVFGAGWERRARLAVVGSALIEPSASEWTTHRI